MQGGNTGLICGRFGLFGGNIDFVFEKKVRFYSLLEHRALARGGW